MKLMDDCLKGYVNLDSREDRREHMANELRRVGLKDAVRYRGMLPQEYKGSPERIRGMLARTQKGAIGCFMSQLAIMDAARLQGRHAFVMEDDLLFCDDFLARMEIVEQFINTHPWDVIWLGGTFHIDRPYWHKELGRDACQTDNPRMMRTFGAFSTHAYIVNRDRLSLVLGKLEQVMPPSWGIDHAFIAIEPSLHTYAFVPGCVSQMDNQSNIGSGWTYFSKFADKLGPHFFQKRMEDFDPATYDWQSAKGKWEYVD